MLKTSDIVLIFPPIRTWDRPRNFPTGIGLIAARLQKAGFRVRVIDVNGLRLSDEELRQKLKAYNPAIVGIGGLITTYSWIKRVGPLIRETLPGARIVLGGSVGASIIETALENLAVDVIATGEADDTVLELMPALLQGQGLDDIKGLAFRREGEIIRTAPRPLRGGLDDLPLPAWDMFPMEVYLRNPVVGVGKDIDVISSRGCPYNCQYCYHFFGRRFRRRSAAHVVEEVQALKSNYDVDFISFQDDCFVIDKARVYEICDLLDKEGLSKQLRWSCTGRVTVCDKEMLKRMRASGCVSVSYGIESGSEKILNAMKKNATLSQAKDAIANTRAVGMRCPVSFMIGYPGETRETVMETVEFCREMNIPLSALMFTCPYPGTPLYEQVKNKPFFRQQFPTEEDFVMSLGDAVDWTVNLTDIPDEELKALRDEALVLARENYIPPTEEEIIAQEKALYGEELYRKAQEQLQDEAMREHRRLHGFNEVIKVQASSRYGNNEWLKVDRQPYIIAEAGVNHNGNLETALELINAAAEAGADCVKFQAFTAEDLAVKDAPKAAYQRACGAHGESQYDMLKRLELSRTDFAVLKQHCERRKIDFLVTPFSGRWVKVLVNMGVKAFKLASGNIKDPNLLRTVGKTRLPVIMSTGMSVFDDVLKALEIIKACGVQKIALLHCVSLYPTRLEQCNLKAIQTLATKTGCIAGFSDHTVEVITGALAVVAGAGILEKHFTLDRRQDGPDHRMSLEPKQLAEYIKLARRAYRACGDGEKLPLPEEELTEKAAGKSVVTTQVIKAGTIITRDMVSLKRPGTGISAGKLASVISARARCDLPEDYTIKPEDIEPQ